jgi:cell division protein FtsW
MARKLSTDKVLFVALVALSLFGCVMIYSASAVSAATSGSPYRYLIKQLAALAVGGVAAFVVSRTDYRFFARPWVVYLAFGGAFALCVLALLQPPINAARRWIPLGPVMFQPSEFLKVALVLLLAHQIARKTLTWSDPHKAIRPALLFTVLAAGVVLLEPDLGTAACYVALAAVLLWVAGVRAKLFLLLGAAVIPLVAIAAFAADYRRARLLSFLKPEADPLGAGFQALQSLIAVGAGGIFGNGLGASRQKLFFLPYPHTDFIFAIVGEELGFIGAVGVVLCFGVIAWRGLRAARRAPDAFGALVAAGATAMLVGQAAFNVSVVLALLPTKGIPLPFVSYGGSSLVASWIAAGLILNISQHEVDDRELRAES